MAWISGCFCGVGIIATGGALLYRRQRKSSYEKREPLEQETIAKLSEMFNKMNRDKNNVVTKEEARAFFRSNFGKLSAEAMFSEVDTNHDGMMTFEEWRDFWEQVKGAGYSDQEITDEVSRMMNGDVWVDWFDHRRVSTSPAFKFPSDRHDNLGY
mmetsp:Transcript_52567/g.125547  ORF Transcript_52567/g.125547 Transcript_52567/m.125547 type:complete len:155 (-) Transcript_52567:153-617(-)|eukprot:CAMPEP_0178427988 /NCGR_PEP_ID=MMETSP0689_2-20121128/30037_1 /TAXON_ID=160604 /ORGANISM="Amphidinium massartii, Strain CS-259" /LENGTH=154 /DNA_ID=CAMNT_0020049729 /DNA_START=98 /DNA_END=562 /DNA_ORIENTATION=+